MNAPHTPSPVVESSLVAKRVAATIRPEIRALAAYPVARAEGLIKLDAMENPFGFGAQVRAEIAAAAANVPLNRYPDGGGEAVKSALRRSLALSDAVGLILGNGSDELLQMLTTVIARPGATVLAPDPSFVMYRSYALYAGVPFVGVPLRADFTLDMEAMLDAVAREQPALVWLAYPNNPTGNLFASADVERIIGAAPGIVAVDEAYYAYADRSFLSRVREFPNLIVVRTLSKIGLAGARLGYAVAHPAWIAEIEKVRPPYNVNALTQAVVPVMLAHEALLAGQAATLSGERSRVAAALAALRRVTVFPTQANFVLIRVPDAQHWFATLRDAGILVKNVSAMHPLLANCLRITIGTPVENDALLDALSRYQ